MTVLSTPVATSSRVGVRPATLARRPRHNWLQWLAIALTASGAGLIPWLVVLATCLPVTTRAWNWSTAWAGLDSLEALGLLGTGLLLIRRDARYHLTAAATAALLLADAWFDVTTSAPGPDRMIAIAMAAGVELPAAAACAALAARGYRRGCTCVVMTKWPGRRTRPRGAARLRIRSRRRAMAGTSRGGRWSVRPGSARCCGRGSTGAALGSSVHLCC